MFWEPTSAGTATGLPGTSNLVLAESVTSEATEFVLVNSLACWTSNDASLAGLWFSSQTFRLLKLSSTESIALQIELAITQNNKEKHGKKAAKQNNTKKGQGSGATIESKLVSKNIGV